MPDPRKIKRFRTGAAFESWMRKTHARSDEVWLRIYKKDSGMASITIAEALDVVLCWGWIDGIRKSVDKRSYLQRYTPRRAKSIWSQVNREHIARLTKGWTHDAARATASGGSEGRWPLGCRVRADAQRVAGEFSRRSPEGDRGKSARAENISIARAAEPLCTRLSHHEHEDTGWTREEDRRTRDVGTGRKALSGASLTRFRVSLC